MSLATGLARRREHDVALAAAALALWLLATIGWRPLMLPDEGRYAGVAWEMLRSGDWLTPTLDGLPFFHKPPLFYWITAASLQAFGVHPAAARAAPLLGALAVGFALFLFLRRWAGRDAARASLLVLATLPMYFLGAQFANLDMLVAGCIGTTILLGAHVLLAADAGERPRAAAVAFWVAAATGVLAKGLIGIVLPALVLGAWALALRRPRGLVALVSPLGLIAFVALTAPWHVAMAQRHADFWHYYIVVQHFQRYGQGGFNNVQPFWFYPAVLVLLGLPSVAWLAALRRRAFWTDPQRGALRVLMATWAVLVVGFFSLPASKLIGYVLPAVPPLAVLIAEAAGEDALRATRRWRVGLVIAALLCVGAVAALAWLPRTDARPFAAVLKAQRGADEPVVFAGGYFYDLPLLAGLRTPVAVAEDWDDPAITRRDNWRRELADAARFAAPEDAARLIRYEQLAATLCRAPVAWLVASGTAERRIGGLASTPPLVRSGDAALWRISAASPVCRGTPSDDPARR